MKCIWVRADKSKNIYKINPSNHHKIFGGIKLLILTKLTIMILLDLLINCILKIG